MKFAPLLPLIALASLSGCAAFVGPVEVTRFHTPDTAALGKGAIAVEAGPGMDPASLEFKSYQSAVRQQLQRIGYSDAAPGAGGQIALIKIARIRILPPRNGNPVSVGGSMSTGSFGSGVGLGIGIDLSGQPRERVQTDLSVSIRDKANGTVLWEGRANFTVTSGSPLAETPLGAAKMAEALFRDFPGHSGETIEIK